MRKAIGSITTLCVAAQVALAPMSYAQADWGIFETGDLTTKEILQDSSTAALKVKAASLLTDNDEAFKSKIDAIRGAKESLRLAYYIFSNDYSSSVLTEELIEAANRGVKVSLLLDYHTNYKHLDLLSALEREGAKSRNGGRIEVRLYNRPTREVMIDSFFLTSDCSEQAKKGSMTACSADKLAKADAFFKQESTSVTLGGKVSQLSNPFMSLFLSGLYSKNPGALKLAVFEGSNLDPKAFTSEESKTSPEELEQLKDFGRLLFDAKFKGSLEAKIKLALAFSMYGEAIDPIYRALSTAIPVERERSEAGKKDWKHLTDFLHHKLLVADDQIIQLGGRNIEDSYHTQPNKLSAKYTFMDTDLSIQLKVKDKAVGATFDRLFNFREMVATLPEVRKHAPNDMTTNMDQTMAAVISCQPVKKANFANYPTCVKQTFELSPFKNLENRMNDAIAAMRSKASTFKAQYQPASSKSGTAFASEDVSAMMMTYAENLPFNRALPAGKETRVYGSRTGRDTKDGKSLHSLWEQGLRNACKVSYDTKTKKRVIMHQGYVLFPGNLVSALGSMTNGTWDCRNVDILIVTNSVDTTDLNIINFFARHQLKSILEQANQSSASGKARIRVLEYKKQADQALSLHSKVNVLGDDLMIGSANADVRSYYMDTNNGVYIRGAKKMNETYQKQIGAIVSDQSRVVDVTAALINTPTKVMIEQDIAGLKAMIAARGKADSLTPPREKQLVDLVTKLQTHVYETSKALLDWRLVDVQPVDDFSREEQEKRNRQLQLSDEFNSLMMLL